MQTNNMRKDVSYVIIVDIYDNVPNAEFLCKISCVLDSWMARIQRRPLTHSARTTIAPNVMTSSARRVRTPPCSDEATDAIQRYPENGLPFRRDSGGFDESQSLGTVLG